MLYVVDEIKWDFSKWILGWCMYMLNGELQMEEVCILYQQYDYATQQ